MIEGALLAALNLRMQLLRARRDNGSTTAVGDLSAESSKLRISENTATSFKLSKTARHDDGNCCQ